MEKYKRLTDSETAVMLKNTEGSSWDSEDMEAQRYIRLAELEDKIENGTLIDTTNVCYEKEEEKDRYIIYKLSPIKMIFDFADTEAEAEKKIKEQQQ